MEFLIIGIVGIAIVAITLFMPKKKKGDTNSSETKKSNKEKSVGEKRDTSLRNQLKQKKQNKKQNANAAQSVKPKNEMHIKQAPPSEESMEEQLLRMEIDTDSVQKEVAHSDYTEPDFELSDPIIPEDVQESKKEEPASSTITLGDSPVNQSIHTRRKLNSETKAKKEEEKTAAISFEASSFENFETPSIEDVFSDPEVTENNYKTALFESLPDTEILGNDIDGMKIVEDEVEQVSEDLEQTSTSEKPFEFNQESKSTEDMEQQDSVSEPELDAVSESVEPVDSTKEVTEVNSEQDATIEETQTEKPESDFVPASVSFGAIAGLKFRVRDHKQKASELLPNEPKVPSRKDEVAFVVESMSVKAPTRKGKYIELYNSHLYKDGKRLPWDIRYEATLHEDEEVTVDTGIGIHIPDGYGIRIIPVSNIEEKFGVTLISAPNVSRSEAAYSLKFTVRSAAAAAYIAKNQPLIQVEIFKI